MSMYLVALLLLKLEQRGCVQGAKRPLHVKFFFSECQRGNPIWHSEKTPMQSIGVFVRFT